MSPNTHTHLAFAISDMSFHFRMVIVVIGGTGHIGTYLIPRLVAARHEVILVRSLICRMRLGDRFGELKSTGRQLSKVAASAGK
jgi:NAD(P)-dependent dehydrogenase (short-subunit alcohol dehydrogenase family)